MIGLIKKLFGDETVEKTVIDQKPYWDGIEKKQKAVLEFEDAILRDQHRVVCAVAAWARDTIAKRCTQKLPPNLPRSIPLVLWLPGLSVLEISNIKAADYFDIEQHIYYGNLISGVRPVQPLEEAVLKFPPRIAPPEERERYAGGGGGPRKPK